LLCALSLKKSGLKNDYSRWYIRKWDKIQAVASSPVPDQGRPQFTANFRHIHGVCAAGRGLRVKGFL